MPARAAVPDPSPVSRSRQAVTPRSPDGGAAPERGSVRRLPAPYLRSLHRCRTEIRSARSRWALLCWCEIAQNEVPSSSGYSTIWKLYQQQQTPSRERPGQPVTFTGGAVARSGAAPAREPPGSPSGTEPLWDHFCCPVTAEHPQATGARGAALPNGARHGGANGEPLAGSAGPGPRQANPGRA
ncbi:unnamed protein product [Coccothraustes coccothraustes]